MLPPIAFLALLLGLVLGAQPSEATNTLEIGITKLADFYEIDFTAGKTGGGTCELTRPSSPSGVSCMISGQDEFVVPILTNLSFSQMQTEIGTNWTLSWDGGVTTATIVFGSIEAADFFSLPTIQNPLDGATNVPPTMSIVWNYGSVPPAAAQLDRVEVELKGPGGAERHSGELTPPADTSSWTPSEPLTPGEWMAQVNNAHDPGVVTGGWIVAPDGTISPLPVGEAWLLQNGDWLALESADRSTFTVIPEPSTALLLSLGLTALRWSARGSTRR